MDDNRIKQYIESDGGSKDRYISPEEAKTIRIAGIAIMGKIAEHDTFSNSMVAKLVVEYPDLSIKERVCVGMWVDAMLSHAKACGHIGNAE